jgi:hypothetical protein
MFEPMAKMVLVDSIKHLKAAIISLEMQPTKSIASRMYCNISTGELMCDQTRKKFPYLRFGSVPAQ